jgi:drug/metabolite transporter (DMT)-like permease
MGGRSLAAGMILLAIAQARGGALPPARAWGPAAVAGVLLFVGCHGALAYAQRYVPSGLAAVVLATIPFWMVLLNASRPRRCVGSPSSRCCPASSVSP